MLKYLLIISITLVAGFLVSACSTRNGQKPPGLTAGRLAPCPDKPNCVCSENYPGNNIVQPLPGNELEKAVNAIVGLGGTVEERSEDYLWATFQSRIFRFTDDLELRLDQDAGVIHVRSSSRTGYSDLGVNRRRVDKLRSILDPARLEKKDKAL